jgi:hypothetical protein
MADSAQKVAAVQFWPGAAAPLTNGLIAYDESDSNGAPQIWVVAPDGTQQTQLTSGAICGGCVSEAPQWLPDGSRIYFDSDRAGNVHIFSMKPDGSDVQQVTHSADGFEGFPAISPDGSKLAYDFFNDVTADQGIVVANIDGSNPQQLTTPTIAGRIRSPSTRFPTSAPTARSPLSASALLVRPRRAARGEGRSASARRSGLSTKRRAKLIVQPQPNTLGTNSFGSSGFHSRERIRSRVGRRQS